MKTKLFIHSEALKCASNETESSYKNKFCDFVKDLVSIHNMKMDDHFCVSKNLCMEPLCNGRDILSIANETLCGDEIGILYRVLANTAQECDLPLSQLKELCLYHAEETECCTLAVLNSDKDMKKKDNPYITFDCYEIVYGKKIGLLSDDKFWEIIRKRRIGLSRVASCCFLNFFSIRIAPNLFLDISIKFQGKLCTICLVLMIGLFCLERHLVLHKQMIFWKALLENMVWIKKDLLKGMRNIKNHSLICFR